MTNPLRISYSSRELIHSCERKFQLVKLVNEPPTREEREYFSHGHAFGAGVASYLLHGDKDKALFECWLRYWPIIDTDEYNAYIAGALLQGAFFKLDEIRRDYEVAIFENKPAIELAARIDVNEGIYDVAFIDVVLRHKASGIYGVFECKTTSSRLNDLTPMYKNSGQTIGYSIIVDAIAGAAQSSFETIYFIGQMKGKSLEDVVFHVMPIRRTIMDRLNWFVTLGLDVQRLQQMIQINYFPMRGGSCLKFNRPCEFFGTCQLRKTDVPREQPEDDNVYQFRFKLDDMVADHMNRVKELL